MKKILVACSVLLIAFTGSAFAGRYDNYLSLRLGYVSGTVNDYDGTLTGIGGTFAFGQNYRAQDWLQFRAEFEAAYQTQSHDDITLQPMGAMINFYADFGPRSWLILPYVGAGFGVKYISVTNSVADVDSSTGIAWNAQGGVTFDFTEELKLDIGVRYEAITPPDFTLKNFGASAGARWYF